MITGLTVPGLPSPRMELTGKVLRHQVEAREDCADFSCCLQGVDSAWKVPERPSVTEVEGSYSYHTPGGLGKASFVVTDADSRPNLQLSWEREYPMQDPNVLRIVNPGPGDSGTVVRIPIEGMVSSQADFPEQGVEAVWFDSGKGQLLVTDRMGAERRYLVRDGVLAEFSA